MKHKINCKGKIIDFTRQKVMGILNITPDSFYDGGIYNDIHKAEKRISEMIGEGADIIDIGAFSSRPGVQIPDSNEEQKILKPILKIITDKFSETIFSLDTVHSETAKMAVNEYGISIINDISAGDYDNNMFKTIGELNVPYIMMHMLNNPETMQNNPSYNNIIAELLNYFNDKIKLAEKYNINNIIIDPGFGFGKTLEHNYEILAKLKEFKSLGVPILAGLSRKSMIYKLLNCTPSEALSGTIAANTIAVLNGANILRVHDVKETVELICVVGAGV
jgi:dihydropteroate synthase